MKSLGLRDPAWLWTRESHPVVDAKKGTVTWSCVQGSDYWRLTASGVVAHNGHSRVIPVEGDFSLEGDFSAELAVQYDQVGLIVIKSPTEWFKASFELDGQIYVGGVHTRETSDWSLAPATFPGGLMLVRRSEVVELSWRPQGGEWAKLRQLTLGGPASAGFYSASPLGPGFQASVAGLRFSLEE